MSDTDDSGMGRSVNMYESSDCLSARIPSVVARPNNKSRQRNDLFTQLRQAANRNLPPVNRASSEDSQKSKASGDIIQKK